MPVDTALMNVRRSITLFMSLVVVAVLASISLAGPGRFSRSSAWQDHVNAIEDPSTEGACVEPTDVAECDTDDSEETDGEASVGTPEDADREADCLEAVGIESSDGSEEGEVTKAHGLDNAIEHVLVNCLKNPQSPGLLNALEHLVANRERHEAHEAWKTERKADKAAGHGNGHDGEHGNPHDSSDGGGNGNSGSHGNGNH
ncbi:MAG: hypothetical protein M3Q20_03350 [Actinomycetota bacterium]|nr:hypothetical protein [Actinomycetota bacterium]